MIAFGGALAIAALPAIPASAADAPAPASPSAAPPGTTVVQVPVPSSTGASPPKLDGKKEMPTKEKAAAAAAAAAACPSSTCDMTYHGGPVQTSPKVRIIFAGTAWNNAFTSYGVSRDTYWNYIAATLRYGGSGYFGTLTQYCQGVASGTINCGGAGTHITNPGGQWDNAFYIYNDNNPPTSPSDSYISGVADALRQYLYGTFGNDSNVNFMVWTLPDHNTPGFGSSFCAWHSTYFHFFSFSNVQFTNMPFIPQAYGSCGRNSINGDDSFGHGSNDGVSIVGMHEIAETASDPQLNAWYDTNLSGEIGDKCAWQSLTNMKWSGQYLANQPEWSNLAFGCVFNQFPGIVRSPTGYNWGNVRVGFNGNIATFYATNTGDADLFPTNTTFTGDSSHFFVYYNGCSGRRVVPGSYCYVQIYSHPYTMGLHNATFWLNTTNIGWWTYDLSVNGVAPVISVGPGLGFGNVVIGTTSSAQGMRVANTGTYPLTVSSVSPPSGFAAVSGGSCGAVPFTVAPGGACFQNVVFSPTNEAVYSGNIAFGSDSLGGTNFAGVTGTGEPLLISPASLNFGYVKLGGTSSIQNQTITNRGPNPITINDVQPAGADAIDFTETDTCIGVTLNTNDSCVISTNFAPSRVGGEFASWNVLTTAITGTHNLALTGAGALGVVAFRPGSLGFPDTAVGVSSTEMHLTVINTGPVSLVITSAGISGLNTVDFLITTDTCSSSTLNPGQSCDLGVTFSPADVGALSAQVDITSDSANGVDSAALSGNGI